MSICYRLFVLCYQQFIWYIMLTFNILLLRFSFIKFMFPCVSLSTLIIHTSEALHQIRGVVRVCTACVIATIRGKR